jgi:hypothetical protein
LSLSKENIESANLSRFANSCASVAHFATLFPEAVAAKTDGNGAERIEDTEAIEPDSE